MAVLSLNTSVTTSVPNGSNRLREATAAQHSHLTGPNALNGADAKRSMKPAIHRRSIDRRPSARSVPVPRHR